MAPPEVVVIVHSGTCVLAPPDVVEAHNVGKNYTLLFASLRDLVFDMYVLMRTVPKLNMTGLPMNLDALVIFFYLCGIEI